MASNSRRRLAILAVGTTILAGALLGSAASADPDPPLAGTDVIWGTDPARRTVTIGAHTYQVAPSTAISGRLGQPLPLARLPVAVDDDGWHRNAAAATAQFRAVDTAGGAVLISLRLVEPPE